MYVSLEFPISQPKRTFVSDENIESSSRESMNKYVLFVFYIEYKIYDFQGSEIINKSRFNFIN